MFKEQARAHPQLEDLRQLLLLKSALQDFKLAVGPDGRNRAPLWPFTAATGRNAPASGEFIFGPSTWWRGLIKPAEGMALAYVDWSRTGAGDRGRAVAGPGTAQSGRVRRSLPECSPCEPT